MDEFIKKLIERMLTDKRVGRMSLEAIMDIAAQLAEEYNNGWIPCSERLPEEPQEGVVDFDTLEEYIVMIESAESPTVLFYAGDGEWCRDGIFYKVDMWQPLPEAYSPKEKSEIPNNSAEAWKQRTMSRFERVE